MLSASWMAYPVKVPTPAPASAQVVLQERIVSAALARLRNQRLLSGRVSTGSAPVDGSALVSNPARRASETLVRAAATE